MSDAAQSPAYRVLLPGDPLRARWIAETFLDDVRGFVVRQKLFGVVLPPSVSEDETVIALLRDLDCHINDPGFADAALAVVDGWITDGTLPRP